MPTTDAQFLATALERFRLGADARDKQYQREISDLKFQVPEEQWEENDRRYRGAQVVNNIPIPARPMLSVAAVNEPINLVSNQQRAAQLGVHIHALNEQANPETAEVLEGLYRNCEADSRATIVRSWAYDRVLWCGWGVYKIDKVHDPEGGHWTDQKLVLRRILRQGEVVLDPFAVEPDWSDGEWAFEPFSMRFTTFQKKYPKAKLSRYSEAGLSELGATQPGWISGDTDATRAVRLAWYWTLEKNTRRKVLLDDGSDAYDDEIPEGRSAKTGADARYMDIEERTVHCALINAVDVLESYDWDGKYIPYVVTIGNELQPFDEERRWSGMMTNAKDGARLTNYAASGAVEMAALEPKAPWMAAEGAFEGHETEIQQANLRNWPVIYHKTTGLDGQPIPPPQRVQVDVARLGPNMQLLSMGKDFVNSAMSTYGPARGEQTPAHRSGRAVMALQDQTVQATSHYLDNLANISMMYESRVWLDLAPKVYDRPGRMAYVRDEAGKPSRVMLNQPHRIDPRTQQPVPVATTPGQPLPPDVKLYDVTNGQYGVTVTIGKSSASRLQEGSDALSQIIQADPALMQFIGPEWMSFQDFPGAKAVTTILRKQRDHTMPWLADAPPDAASQLAQAKAQMQQMQQALQKMQQVIAGKQIENQGKLEVAQANNAADTFNAQADREVKLAVAELGAKVDKLTLFMEERARLGLQGQQDAQSALDRAHDVGMAAQDHSQTLDQATQQAALTPPSDNGQPADASEPASAEPEAAQ